jgi:hypothetical protein
MPDNRIRSRDELIEYAFRALGKPVIDINVDWQQASDRLDDALQLFAERHFDGVLHGYLPYSVTQEDFDNKYINTDNIKPPNGITGDSPSGKDIVSVVRIFQYDPLSSSNNMFNIKYQWALSDYFQVNRGLYGTQDLPIANYDNAMRYITLMNQYFSPEKTFAFTKTSNRISINTDWNSDVKVGQGLMFEAYLALDPEKFTEIYNDRILKRYYVQLIKRQWGTNLAKYENIPLPGGGTLRGANMVQEATAEIEKIENEIYTAFEGPPIFQMG